MLLYNFIFIFLSNLFCYKPPASQQVDFCNIYGKIYYTSNKYEADYIIYIAEEGEEDLLVYEEINPLYADKSGHWKTVQKKSFADVVLYKSENKYDAHFKVAYTEDEIFAGCD